VEGVGTPQWPKRNPNQPGQISAPVWGGGKDRGLFPGRNEPGIGSGQKEKLGGESCLDKWGVVYSPKLEKGGDEKRGEVLRTKSRGG